MTPIPPIPEPLEICATKVDNLVTRSSQRQVFRQNGAGLLTLPSEA